MTLDIETIGHGPLTFILMLKSYGVGWWWWWVYLDYNVSSGPFFSYEIEIGDGPGKCKKNIFCGNISLRLYLIT